MFLDHVDGCTSQIGMPLRLRAPLAAAFFITSPNRAEEWLAINADLDLDAERAAMQKIAEDERRQQSSGHQHHAHAFSNNRPNHPKPLAVKLRIIVADAPY